MMNDKNSVVIVTAEKCKPYSVDTFVKNENYGIALETQANNFGAFMQSTENMVKLEQYSDSIRCINALKTKCGSIEKEIRKDALMDYIENNYGKINLNPSEFDGRRQKMLKMSKRFNNLIMGDL